MPVNPNTKDALYEILVSCQTIKQNSQNKVSKLPKQKKKSNVKNSFDGKQIKKGKQGELRVLNKEK